MAIPISGVLHSSGTATHFGRYTADNSAKQCTWDADSGAIKVIGEFRARVANGDSVWGTTLAYARFTATGADFAGETWLTGGTGRFRAATGFANIYSRDEIDGSGTGWGSGWITY